jgi:diguanylate cyclase
LFLSAIAFGVAVTGMHYASMAGMTIDMTSTPDHVMRPLISTSTVMITIVILAFIISATFLLYLIPDAASRPVAVVSSLVKAEFSAVPEANGTAPPSTQADSLTHSKVPIETDGAVRMLPAASICAIQATTHYTLVYDGEREYFSPWSISEAETRLKALGFMRVHRSHLVAIDKVQVLRRSGDGGLIEAGHPTPRLIPVSRSNFAELKARLGLHKFKPEIVESPAEG